MCGPVRVSLTFLFKDVCIAFSLEASMLSVRWDMWWNGVDNDSGNDSEDAVNMFCEVFLSRMVNFDSIKYFRVMRV